MDYCPFVKYCTIIKTGKVDVKDDEFWSGLEEAIRNHKNEALACYSNDRDNCAMTASNWSRPEGSPSHRANYGLSDEVVRWLSITIEPMDDIDI